MKRKHLLIVLILILIGAFLVLKINSHENSYYNNTYNFQFEYPEKWRNKVAVDYAERIGAEEIIFNYTGSKTAINTYQPFFSILIIEKNDEYKEERIEKKDIIKENDKYVIIISRDLDNALKDKEAIEEYRELELSNNEIIKRIEFDY